MKFGDKFKINRGHEIIRWWHRFNNISKIINSNIKSRIALIDETLFQIGEYLLIFK